MLTQCLTYSFQSVVDSTQHAQDSIRHRLTVPVSYNGQRASAIAGFRTGELPIASLGLEPDARKRVEPTILWKILMRNGRGFVGLFEEQLVGDRVMDHARIKVASDIRDKALACEWACKDAEKDSFADTLLHLSLLLSLQS